MTLDANHADLVRAFQWDHTEGDAGVIVNLSTWADAESLRAFVFGGDHVGYLRRRREWFVPITEAHAVCWWVEAGHRPTTDEAEERVRHRRAHGATAPRPTPSTSAARTHRREPRPDGAVGGGWQGSPRTH